MKRLSIGIQDFPTLIEGGFIYADKTELIYRLIQEGVAYFLSRPRRFGKSLLVSTIASLFRGDRNLFAGLWIASSDYTFPKHPVLHLDFSRVRGTSKEELISSLNNHLQELADTFGIGSITKGHPAETLAALIESLTPQGKVVLLIDEYDKPLVNHLDNPALIQNNRELLRDVFATVKAVGNKLRFVFMTGVSKFSRVSLFSGMNNLNDISLDPAYASLLGITESELKGHLGEALQAVEKGRQDPHTLSLMQEWYNGYQFSRHPTAPKVYNPWSVLKFLQRGELANYWFSTATPTFAIDLIKSQGYPLVNFEDGVQAGDELEMSSDIESLELTTLLFQTGYLTIDRYEERFRIYHLKLPNEEVRRSLLEHLFRSYTHQDSWKTHDLMSKLRGYLESANLESFFTSLNTLLTSIPYPIHIPQESYYHSLVYLVVRMLGFAVDAEVMTSDGRIDLVATLDHHLYIFEFKIDRTASEALDQIQRKKYQERYQEAGKKIVLVGANFSTKSRKVDDWATHVALK